MVFLLLLLLLLKSQIIVLIRASPKTPPTTPPAIAPALVPDLLVVLDPNAFRGTILPDGSTATVTKETTTVEKTVDKDEGVNVVGAASTGPIVPVSTPDGHGRVP